MVFLDFEVFKHDWLAVFIDVTNESEKVIVNDRQELTDYYNENIKRIWVGFNINHYDQFIMKGIILGMDPTKINNHIIYNKKPGWEYSDLFWKVKMNIYDVFTGYNGLKTLEAFMGHDIMETSVDFKLDRKLTDDEIQEVIKYCRYDVEQSIEVFIRRQDEFTTKMDLIKEFKLPLHHIGRSNAQLSAIVLGAVNQRRRDEFKIDIPEELRVTKYNDIVRWYTNPVNHNYNKKQEVEVMGVNHIFAWGGLHGARNNYIEEGNFILVDVSSYYPSLMIEYDYMSRNIRNKEEFQNMYNERFRLKSEGDPKEEIFKLVLNTTYGCMGYKFNNLYDPRMRNNVCVTGQLLLLDLLESFDSVSNIKLIQTNTDGILLKYRTNQQLEEIKSIVDEWSHRTRLNVGYDKYNKIIQKDVNNYIALGEEDEFVGGYIKDLHELDNDLPVINKAIRAYFMEGIKPSEYINSENRLIEFQKIVKISRLYDYAIHNGQELQEKTLRVFASKDSTDGPVMKYRPDQTANFANTSENSFINNGNIVGKNIPRKLNKDWYINLANRRIKQFKGVI